MTVVTLFPNEIISITPSGGTLQLTPTGDSFIVTCESLVPPPDPDPLPGVVVFTSDFEPEDYALWTQDNGYFEDGNTKTHGTIPVPPEMGLRSLRMKQANGAVAGCEFPPGEYDSITRLIDLPVGDYVAVLWRVAHDTGVHIFSIWQDVFALGEWEGTAGLNETEWIRTEHPFTVDEAGPVELEFSYVAPRQVTQATGVKVALLQILTA